MLHDIRLEHSVLIRGVQVDSSVGDRVTADRRASHPPGALHQSTSRAAYSRDKDGKKVLAVDR